MKQIISITALLCLLAPTAALSETEGSGLVRPGDAEGTASTSDGLAECAAILAIASTVSPNLIERKSLEDSSAGWFAASGDQAIAEGSSASTDVWGEKVSNWAGRIGSLNALSQNGEWMNYCAGLGQQQGLGAGPFAKYAPPTETVTQ